MNQAYTLFNYMDIAVSVHLIDENNPLNSSVEFINHSFLTLFKRQPNTLNDILSTLHIKIDNQLFKDAANGTACNINDINIIPIKDKYFACLYAKHIFIHPYKTYHEIDTFLSYDKHKYKGERIPRIIFEFNINCKDDFLISDTKSELKGIFQLNPDMENKQLKNIHPDDLPFVIQSINDSLYDFHTLDIEYRVFTEDGDIMWVSNHSTPEVSLNRSLVFIGTLTDISDMKRLENQLEEKEELYRLLFDTSIDAIIITTKENRILSANSAAQKLFGGTEDELKKYLSNQLFVDDNKNIKEAIHRRNTTGNYFGEHQFKTKNGDILNVEVNSSLFTNSKGEVQSSLFIHDISKRKKIESNLIFRESLFRTTLSTLNEGVLLIDNDGIITYTNPKITHLLNENIDFVGKSLSEFYIKQDEHVRMMIINHLDQVRLSQKPSYKRETIDIKRWDGTTIPIQLWAAPIIEHSNLTGLIIIIRDITTETEQAMQIEGFLNVNLNMICVTDVAGNFVRVNHRFEEMIGYTSNELEGKAYLSFIHPDDLESTIIATQALAKRENITGFTNRYRTRNGQYRFLQWIAKPGYGNYVYASAHDITDQVEKERSLQELATLDVLTGLRNRRALENDILSLIELSNRYSENTSIIMFDLDHFKNVNDSYGHDAGDEVLKVLSRLTEEVVRGSDLIYRIGGEEFIIVLPKTNIHGATILAEKLRQKIESVDFPFVGKLTISLGVVEHMKTESLRQILIRADKALYEAKKTGRNKVVSKKNMYESTDFHNKIEWYDSYNSGNAEIDKQHQTLIELGDELVHLNETNATKLQIDECLAKLYSSLESHFNYENNYLKQINYYDTQNHILIHSDLLTKLSTKIDLYQSHKLGSKALFSHIVDDIILGHMIDEDKKFFIYIY